MIWNNDLLLNNYRQLKWIPKKCKKCTLFNRCHAGCKETRKDAFSYDILLDEVEDEEL